MVPSAGARFNLNTTVMLLRRTYRGVTVSLRKGNTLVTKCRFLARPRVRARTKLEAEAPGYGTGPGLLPSSHCDADGVVTAGARRVRRGLLRGLGLAFAVGGAHLEGVLAGIGVPVVDPLPPGIQGELFRKAGLVPSRATVGSSASRSQPTVGCPSDAADRGLAGGDL